MLQAAIPAEFERFVAGQIEAGNYQTAEEIVAESLGLLRDKKMAALRQMIQEGVDELDRGEGIEIDDEAGLKAFFDGIMVEVQQELETEKSR